MRADLEFVFPVKDDNPTSSRALVTYSLILVNIAVFTYEAMLATRGELDVFLLTYALIPRHITAGVEIHTLFSSMFLHGGLMHIAGNMLYLHIFGDNVEDAMGKTRFLVFYLLCGLAASFLQISINPSSGVPNVGASGAIAGVLGAYLMLFPRAKVHTVVFLGYFMRWVRLPAFLILGFWFVIQLFSGFGSLVQLSPDVGGVAFFAHVGGFVAGMVLVWVFKKR